LFLLQSSKRWGQRDIISKKTRDFEDFPPLAQSASALLDPITRWSKPQTLQRRPLETHQPGRTRKDDMNDIERTIERMEMEAFLDLYAAAPAALADTLGLKTARFGDEAFFGLRSLPATLFNRSLGLGVASPAAEQDVDRAVDWLRAHGNPSWSVGLAPDALPSELPAWLSARGLRAKGGGMAKFWRAPTPPAQRASSGFDIRAVGVEGAADFGGAVCAGFGLPGSFAPWMGALAGRPRWRAYVAYDGAAPAAVGALFIEHGHAWLGVGATLPAYRGRGAQQALLSRRMHDAIGLGVEGLAVETGHPEAGQVAGVSYRNIERAGFELSHVRAGYGAN
jgi:hypothetical protein